MLLNLIRVILEETFFEFCFEFFDQVFLGSILSLGLLAGSIVGCD